jgi:hypothetical protein
MMREALTTLAETLHAVGDFDLAIGSAREAVEISKDQIVGSRRRARALGTLCRALDAVGDHDAMREVMAEQQEILADLDDPRLARTQLTDPTTGTTFTPRQRSEEPPSVRNRHPEG